MTTVLLTGFEPFGGDAANPSWDAVELADVPGVNLVKQLLPCGFDASVTVLRKAVEAADPDLVIAVGLAGGREAITPERVAINLDDARIPDNSGRSPVDEPVVDGGPAAYFTGLPVKAGVAALRAAGLPAAVSHTAGTFVCNHVFYGLMHLIATERPGLRGGFVHVPYSSEMAVPDAPSLPLRAIADGLAVLTRTCVDTSDDLAVTGGTLH
ncbi:pyroglutamyl-peptidase I [Kutzneria sp. CA-103260]|uniref:pyroglutamyl-peptidase I n=1 Tax=Kutzneria sp. CA-103260 TaxID=2802641 RepID=UPI001BA6B10E|nr:pyroglutamyl-peptidase I [Kutzneria sp. CA-103260]QUQ62678.1 pyroglutamyl-peptidase [Kutzneria sp. CA-103260]